MPLPPVAPKQAFGGQIDAAYLAKVAILQDVLGVTTRKTIEDSAFAAVFADDAAIRASWPVVFRGAGL